VLAREARIQVLEDQLEVARREVVRTMARSQAVASRAEAASGIAEAELALRTLRTTAGRRPAPEAAPAQGLLDESSAEFKKGNFGGALYLASEARGYALRGTDRFSRTEGENLRPGETQFQVPLRLRSTTRANVRDGPSTSYRVLFTLDPDQPVTGSSYVEGWVRVTDEQGRSGWIARSLVESRN
jgi:Bacterial SH3 domain